jgi:DNA (cytosine-5)-methyltransferase 1
MIRFIDMFCGIGGFRLGLETCNWQQQKNPEIGRCEDSLGNQRKQSKQSEEWGNYACVWANDNDRYACQIYRKHWNDGTLHEGNIRAVDTDAIPEHDLLCAGFPCQSFSIAGKRRGFEDTRGTLFFEICRVIRAKRPSYLLLENVRGLLSHDLGQTFEVILSSLYELGYDCQWQVLNSKDFGVPQNRERVFIVGHLRGKPRPKVFPLGEDGEGVVERAGETTSVRTLQGGGHSGGHHSGMTVIQAGIRSKGKPRFYEGEVPAMAQAYGTGGGNVPMIFDIYNKGLRANQDLAGTLKGEGVADTSLGTALIYHENISGKRTPHKEAQALRGKASYNYQTIEIANALDADGYLRTGARPRDKNGKPQLLPIGYRRIRRLTPLECERLQGFPDGWTEGISDTQRYKCLGNAVTVNVIEAIGRQLFLNLNNREDSGYVF